VYLCERQCLNSTGVVEENLQQGPRIELCPLKKISLSFRKGNNLLIISGLFDNDETGSLDTQCLSAVLEEMC
jgi:hypothetical protein